MEDSEKTVEKRESRTGSPNNETSTSPPKTPVKEGEVKK